MDALHDSARGGSKVRASSGAALAGKSFLQEVRSRAVPPLPEVLNLRGQLPSFEEESGALPGSGLFPTFSDLKPLVLRSQSHRHPGQASTSTSDAASTATGSVGNSVPSTGSSSGGGTGISSGSSSSLPREGLRVGIVLCGERASVPAYPTNVIAGLFEYLSMAAPGSKLIGFSDGPEGFLEGRSQELSAEEIRASLNQGSWKLLNYSSCSEGDFSMEARAQEAKTAADVCEQHCLDSLVLVAGPKDLSWAATLAVWFKELSCNTGVIGVPHSKNLNFYVPRYLPVTLGFDSARYMLSEVAGNIFVDSLSSKKYWHFIRCGEDALTMEVALQTRCTFSVLTMERRPATAHGSSGNEDRMSLEDAVAQLRQVIDRRRSVGRLSGVVLLSRQLIETLPEMDQLKNELAELVGDAEALAKGKPPSIQEVEKQLKHENTRALFKRLPRIVQMSLILQRDAAGMPLLPRDLEAERILGRFVQQELRKSAETSGERVKATFAPRFHTMELMSTSPLSSPFDCAFGYLLGHTVGALVCERRTFYVACCANMHRPTKEWEPCAVPFSSLYLWRREGGAHTSLCPAEPIPKTGWLLRKNLVEVYRHFREAWVECNQFKAPGPMQFGPDGGVGPLSERPFTLLAEYLSLEEIKQLVQPVIQLPPPLLVSSEPVVVRDVRVSDNLSHLERERLVYRPRVPSYLRGQVSSQDDVLAPHACDDIEELSQSFPLTHAQVSALRLVPSSGAAQHGEAAPEPALPASRQAQNKSLKVGLVFASNQVPGYHTVVAGIFDYLSSLSSETKLVGFLCGYEGLLKDQHAEITGEMVDQYRNLGGQDMLCQFGDPPTLAFKDHMQAAIKTIARHQLDGLVMVGNLVSQVDAAFLSEACAAEKLGTKVIGVPVSLDCNFPFVQQTVGYDTVTRTLTSFIGDIGALTKSNGNMWIFVRTMGDAYSHVAVQCTLQTHVHMVLLSGSQLLGQYLANIVKCLCDLIVKRHEAGENHGVIVLPVGFVNDILELRLLFSELLEVMSGSHYDTSWDSIPKIAAKLKPSTAALFDVIPRDVQYEICFGGRERHTNKVDFSNVSTDRLLLRFVEIELQRRRQLGEIKEDFFKGSCYPMAYQARSAVPTNFDCDLAYTLGMGAGILVDLGKSGQLVHASRLERDVDEWQVRGLPLTCLLRTEFDEESKEHRILPSNVHLLKQRGVIRPFKGLPRPDIRDILYQGPVQYAGASADMPAVRTTWYMENHHIQDPTDVLQDIALLCGELQSTMALAKAESTLFAVNGILSNAVSVLDSYKHLDDSKKRELRSLADVPVDQMAKVWTTKHGERDTKVPKTVVQQELPPRRLDSAYSSR